jgi:murein DD-endopeptidase MepM/ murein hydrolase activator NlpD
MARRCCLVLPLLIGLWTAPHAAPDPERESRTAGPATALAASSAAPVPQAGTWSWPVTGPVIRGFDPPDNPYGSGHRGIDIATAFGTAIRAPAAGVVTFSGKVGGQLFITLDHGDGLSSTYSWLSSTGVHKGDHVSRGATIGATGTGHPGSSVAHLHFGVKLDGGYIDPMIMLAPMSLVGLIRLAPLVG